MTCKLIVGHGRNLLDICSIEPPPDQLAAMNAREIAAMMTAPHGTKTGLQNGVWHFRYSRRTFGTLLCTKHKENPYAGNFLRRIFACSRSVAQIFSAAARYECNRRSLDGLDETRILTTVSRGVQHQTLIFKFNRTSYPLCGQYPMLLGSILLSCSKSCTNHKQ